MSPARGPKKIGGLAFSCGNGALIRVRVKNTREPQKYLRPTARQPDREGDSPDGLFAIRKSHNTGTISRTRPICPRRNIGFVLAITLESIAGERPVIVRWSEGRERKKTRGEYRIREKGPILKKQEKTEQDRNSSLYSWGN